MRRRLERLAAVCELATLAESRLRTFCERVPELLEGLRREKAARQLGLSEIPPDSVCWGKTVEKALPGEDGETAGRFFAALGREDLESTLRRARETAEFYKERHNRLLPEVEGRAALFARLGLAAGLMLLLLLA